MLMHQHLAPGSLHEVIAAVLASASLAAGDGNLVAAILDAYHVARHPHDLPDEVLLLPRGVAMSHLHGLARVA